jgi:hypothetical protein
MLRISKGTLSPAHNTPLAKIWRPVAALTAILAVAVFVGVVVGAVSLVGSRTATSLQPVSGAINPPVVGDTTERTGIPIDGTHPTKTPVVRDTGDYIGIPYAGTGPAADIIRGGYVDGTHPTNTPVVRDTGDYIGIPYVGTGPAADIIRGGYVDTNGR